MHINQIDLRKIKSTLIVLYCGRSGSYLFSNLMDSHPEVLSCPPDALENIIENVIKILFSYQQNPSLFTPDKLVDQLISDCPNLFIENNKKKPKSCLVAKLSRGITKEIFREKATALLMSHINRHGFPVLCSDIFSLIHWAYALSLGRDMNTKQPIICWQRHNVVTVKKAPIYASNVINPIFITTVRRFEDALDSHLVVMGEYFNTQRELCEVIFSQLVYNLCKRELNTQQYAVKFEDMHKNTEKVMSAICKILGINYDPILLDTTLDGEQYYFEKSPGNFVTGVNKKLKKKMSFDLLNEADILLLNLLLKRDYMFYNYELSSLSQLGTSINQNFKDTGETIMDIFEKTNLLNGSYLLESTLHKESTVYLPKIISNQIFKKDLEILN